MRAAVRPPILLAAMFLLGSLAACATRPPASEPDALAEYNQTNDPLEPTNRVLYNVNDAIDAVILKPVALAYHYAVPSFLRDHVHDALSNLNRPVVFANEVLQGKPSKAGNTAVRFVINSTIGLGGLFDPATGFGYPEHSTDFGITMALWGVPSGPFLFLPVLGPTDPRDAAGYGGDIALDPFTWLGHGATVVNLGYARYSVTAADQRDRANDEINQIKSSALDPYATFRSLYRQHRDSQIEQARGNGNRPVVPAADQTAPGPAAPAK